MNDICLVFDYEELIGTAGKYFMDACGFLDDTENQSLYIQEGLRVLANCRKNIDPHAVLTSVDSTCYQNHMLSIQDVSFQCTAFEQIPDDNILQVYIYFVTVGPCNIQDKNLSEQYYADVWGEGFLESCRERIRAFVMSDSKSRFEHPYVTYSFGPGFYGMHPEKLKDLAQILDPSSIGITVAPDGTPSPEKSCGGFLFAVRDKEQLPSEICKDCIGSDEGCQFCGGKNRIPSKEACLELLHSYGTPPHVIAHCLAVADTAGRIGRLLKEKGLPIDLDLLEGASLLHDIARTEENHGVKGAKIAIRHGYHKTGKLIKRHMFYISDPYHDRIDEQDILCLADRMIKEDKYVGLESRMQSVLDKYSDDPVATVRILQRLDENRILIRRIEELIGNDLDDLLRQKVVDEV